MEMILIRFFTRIFHFLFHYFVFDLSNERRVVVFSPPFLRIRKFFVVGKKSKEGGIFTLISESGFEFFSSKSRSHFLQLVIGMTDRQTLSATFRNSDSRESYSSDIPKLSSEAQNEMCSQLGASQLGTKRERQRKSFE